jgi:hypothetical protein
MWTSVFTVELFAHALKRVDGGGLVREVVPPRECATLRSCSLARGQRIEGGTDFEAGATVPCTLALSPQSGDPSSCRPSPHQRCGH